MKWHNPKRLTAVRRWIGSQAADTVTVPSRVQRRGSSVSPHPMFRLLTIVTAAALPLCAHAELGGSVANVRGEAARMNARVASVSMGRYTRHDLTRANGGSVREFTNANGQVFAVTWSGPGKPDLRALLGHHFAALQASSARGRAAHALRRPPQVSEGDLQIQTAGHMGWFHGVAFIPSLAPAGFSPADLPQGL